MKQSKVLTDEARRVEQELKGLSWEEVDERLADESDQLLLQLLDSSSVKIGDSAASRLSRRGCQQIVMDSLWKQQIPSAVGRLRALSILSDLGATLPQSIPVLIKLLSDKSDGVAGEALGSLVLFRYHLVIPLLLAQLSISKSGDRKVPLLKSAINSLRNQDPFEFANLRYYCRDQARQHWRLDEPPVWLNDPELAEMKFMEEKVPGTYST